MKYKNTPKKYHFKSNKKVKAAFSCSLTQFFKKVLHFVQNKLGTKGLPKDNVAHNMVSIMIQLAFNANLPNPQLLTQCANRNTAFFYSSLKVVMQSSDQKMCAKAHIYISEENVCKMSYISKRILVNTTHTQIHYIRENRI